MEGRGRRKGGREWWVRKGKKEGKGRRELDKGNNLEGGKGRERMVGKGEREREGENRG